MIIKGSIQARSHTIVTYARNHIPQVQTCHNIKKTAGHLKMLESIKTTVTLSASTSFVDCGEANIKLEVKEEETLDEDPLSIKMEAENVAETIKHEIEEDIQDTKSDDDRMNTIDIVENKIEIY